MVAIDMNPQNEYERAQLAAIEAWKEEEPGIISKSLGYLAPPISWAAERLIPEKAIRGAIVAVDFAAYRLARSEGIKQAAGVDAIAELRRRDLQRSDELADPIQKWAIGLATAEGTAAGLGGFLTLSADMPVIIILALRTIYEIGLCYGFEFKNKREKQFILGVLAASSANSRGDKRQVLEKLHRIKLSYSPSGDQPPERLDHDGSMPSFEIEYLSKAVGLNLTKRKALQMLPAVGAIVGGSVNGWYMKDVGWAARRCFQERWLEENYKPAR